MDHHETIPQLNDAIVERSDELQVLFHERWARWYSLAISDVALLTGGSEVLLADTVVTPNDSSDGAYFAQITIFTEHLVITVTATVSADSESHTTRARSRAALKSLEVAAGIGALEEGHPGATWPGRVQVTLDYGDAAPLKLPGSKRADQEQHAKVVALLPSLRADLTA